MDHRVAAGTVISMMSDRRATTIRFIVSIGVAAVAVVGVACGDESAVRTQPSGAVQTTAPVPPVPTGPTDADVAAARAAGYAAGQAAEHTKRNAAVRKARREGRASGAKAGRKVGQQTALSGLHVGSYYIVQIARRVGTPTVVRNWSIRTGREYELRDGEIYYREKSTIPSGGSGCDPNYAGACVPTGIGDVDCDQVAGKDFFVVGVDVDGLDRDKDGIACES
jgi:hypothetical protein